MPKRGRPTNSQQSQQDGAKQLTVNIEDAVDDLLPVGIAQKFRKRLTEASTSSAQTESEDKKNKGRKDDYLYCRRTPAEFLACLKNLTPQQKAAVAELGFEAVLGFEAKEIPGRLAHWVLSSFNLARCQIALTGGVNLDLDEKDVRLTLGFPKGRTAISRPTEHQSQFAFNDMIVARCGKGRFKMSPKDISHLMMQKVKGGDVFKKLYMFMVENVLIETPADGHCKPKILNFIDDVDEIRHLNWCGYVLSVLEATYPSWANRQSVNFSGPIYFLVGAYVDRVVHCRRRVIHSWPTIKGWTSEDLKQRDDVEHGQYGTGRLEARIDKEKWLEEKEVRKLEMSIRGEPAVPGGVGAYSFRKQFAASSTQMARAISAWLDDYNRIPEDLLDDVCFRAGSQIGKKLLGMEDQDAVADEEIVTRLTQARDDEEEFSPEWIVELETMMAAYDKKKTINKSTTRPSFVLDGFNCPDPFATQPSDGSGGSGTAGKQAPHVDIAPEAPIIGQPGGEDVEEDVGIPAPFVYNIPDITHTGAGVIDPQLQQADIVVGGSLRSTTEEQVNASVVESVREAV
ncbi:uncharacterized protein LOC121762870 [Salvia splendens]|uniref:uncharacterized protein LOC121762870 n=1 Tax=Salvia splendens TaxID=180675 RepID=UPI001C278760|nr:uncharacterized protein LOC121762870 [Salvia splendens]XP_042014826.1 uncharacterized protein LOC121762870 [Salvia splendens]